MKILLSSDLEPVTLSSYNNVLKVFIYAGYECFIWDRRAKSCFDVFDEIKPDLFISRKVLPKEESLLKQYNTSHIEANSILAPDVFLYRPMEITEKNRELFNCDYMSIVNHSRDEFDNLKSYIGAGLSFKLFTPFHYTLTEYCQNIPEEMHSSALSCAKSVIATNFLNFYNFTLANENTIYPLYSTSKGISKQKLLDNINCFTVTSNLIEEYRLQDKFNIDFKALYSKFRNENKI